jgi:hypothetical protein
MKKFSLIILSILFLNSFSQNENSVFQVGERLKYEISYNWGLVWIDAGEVNFLVKKQKNKLRLIGTGSTYESYDWFFKVRDVYQSYVDPQTLDPYYFKRDVDEGGYKIKSRITFDRENNLAYSKYKDNTKPVALDTIELDNGVVDIVTLLYKTRLLDIKKMKKGDIVNLKVIIDKEISTIQLKYEGLEKIKVKKMGRYNSVKFSVDLLGGNYFEDGEKMSLWVSNDKNKIPLQIEAPILVGKVKMHIVSHEGLKYAIDSKLN